MNAYTSALVTFKANISETQADKIKVALELLSGVVGVEFNPHDINASMAEMRANAKVKEKLVEIYESMP